MSGQLTLLGVGASAGTPVVGCECSTCQSTNKKNYRTRCSSLLTLKNGKNILIDTSPDLRLQSLREGLTSIDAVLFTHHHADHTGGNLDLKEKFDTKIYGPGSVKGRIPGLSHPLFGGETFRLGTHAVHVFSTPGHTVDHVIYYVPDAKSAFVGDTLFALGCGRLFEGSKEDMYSSLKKISNFPDDTKLYCAHEYTLSNAEFALTVEPANDDLKNYISKAKELRALGLPTVPTTVASEKKCNPFLRAASASQLGEIRAAKDVF